MSAIKDSAYKRRFRQQPANMRGVREFPMSFETGEAGVTKLYFQFPVTITKIRSIVTKALAATDAGTLTGANASGASTGGVITHAASAALGNEQSVTPSTNVDVDADSYYQITSAKTTAGGRSLVAVEYVTR